LAWQIAQAAPSCVFGELRKDGGCDELHGMPGQDRFAPKSDRKVRLANAGWPEQQDILPIGGPACARKLTYLLGIYRGLGPKSRGPTDLERREANEFEGHFDAPLILAGDLALAQQYQRLT
jgi:hypothetical protein